MLRNFMAMPLLLKLITLFGLFHLVFGLNTLFPFGKLPGIAWPMTYSEWWSSGQGLVYFAKTVGLGVTCLLFLLRIGWARLAHLAVIGVIMVEPAIKESSHPDEIKMNIVLFVAGAGYLYLSRSVRTYFEGGRAIRPVTDGRDAVGTADSGTTDQ